MTPRLLALFELARNSPLTWDAEKGGKRAWICFVDDKTYDLGGDPEKLRFAKISERMLSGNYYPPDAVRFFFQPSKTDHHLAVGDRILQRAPFFCRLGGPLLNSAVEIYAAEQSDSHCKIGYITTDFHYGRGMWTAELKWENGRLSIRVWSIASPHSILFWIGLPIARAIQLRARSRAIEEFTRL